MPSLKTLLQLPCGWQSSRQIISSDGLTLHLRATRKTAQCPECLQRSSSVHSCRRRRRQHLPCSGQTLWLIFTVRHWYCRNPSCSRKIFAESLAPFAGPQQQSSTLLQNMQHQLGLIAGGEAGRRAAVASGMQNCAKRWAGYRHRLQPNPGTACCARDTTRVKNTAHSKKVASNICVV
ncbi:transposase [Serratia sp. DD3]|nr:transposase [Serratia sp. DD3]KEY60189.1 transposase [Serratia sp. DD3]